MEFKTWLQEVKNHLVITKTINKNTVLHEPSFLQMYSNGFSVREAVNSSIRDESISDGIVFTNRDNIN